MLTIQQMVRAVRDIQKRVDALEASGKPVVPVITAETPVRRGRPPMAVEEVAPTAPTAPITLTAPADPVEPLPLNEV